MKKLSMIVILLTILALFAGCKTDHSGESSSALTDLYISGGQVIELPGY